MYYKVKITKNPKAKTGMQVQGALYNDETSFGGFNMQNGKKNLIESKYITAVPKEEANLEAEGGETVYGDLNGDTFPEHKIIKGPRHSKGGVPLKLPDDSFIFSDTNSMKINDPNILQMFNQPDRKGKGVTPATLAKQYDIDSYRKILQDPNTDKIARRTAELMIRNYNMKLGALALAQESKKGFPQGIPEMAKPYMEYAGIDEAKLLPPELPEPQAPQQQMQQQMPQEQMSQEQMPPQDMQQMEQPFPDQMSRFGGQRRLRRAQEGMQQPSPEEMAMMEQQQAQQQPQQGQGGDQMQQIMQQVGQALQQGAQPEEVAAQLIQSQIPPEQVAQIFVQLGMPEQQVQQLIAGVMQQMEGGQEQQMDPRQQQQQISEEEMMAMQQQDPQQMQQAPMAMYGMQMGGYNMPFSNPSYSYAEGGEPCDNGKNIYPDFAKFGCITESQYNSLVEQAKANLEKQKVFKETRLADQKALRNAYADPVLFEKLKAEWKTKYPGDKYACLNDSCPEYDLVLDPEPVIPPVEIPEEIPEIPELSLSGYPDPPLYNRPVRTKMVPSVKVEKGNVKSIKFNLPKYHKNNYLTGKTDAPPFHGKKPHHINYTPRRLDFDMMEKDRFIPRLIQKKTGWDENYMEGYWDENGNEITGEQENAERENRQINFKGIASLRDKKEQERYNKEWEKYNIEKAGIREYNLNLIKEAGISPEEYVKKYGEFKNGGGLHRFVGGGEPCPPCPDGTVPIRTEAGDCPCANNVEDLEFYKFALKERDYIASNPGMWEGDPDMTNEDGSYKFCVDCLVKDYNDPNVVKSVSALINNGIANFPKYDYPDLMKGLEKFNLPIPVYQSTMQKKRGGSTNSNMNSMAQYGMQMGGYNMPFAQDGLDFGEGERMAGDPNIPWQADYNRNIHPYYSPRPPQIRNTTTNWIHPNLPDSNNLNSPMDKWREIHSSQENYDNFKNQEPPIELINLMNQTVPIEQLQIPKQQYGGYMELGGYEMPDYMAYGGSPSYSYARGGSIPKYVDGGEPPKGIVVKRSDYADEAAYQIGLRKAKLKQNTSKEDIYTLKPDGTYVKMKVSDKKASPYTGDKAGWSGKDEVAAKYAAMEAALQDKTTAKLFADATRKALLDSKSYVGKSGSTSALYETRGFGNVADLSDKEIVDNYLEHQKRNLQLAASGNESFLYNDSDGKLRKKTGAGKGDNKGFVEIMKTLTKPDGTAYTDAEIEAKYNDMLANAPTLDKAFEKLGIPMQAVAKGSSAYEKKALLQQATFQGYNQLINNAKNLSEDDQLRLMNFRGNVQRGYSDESGQGVSDISPIDAYYTNTTAGQISDYGDYQFDEIPGEKPKEEPKKEEEPDDEIEIPPPPQPAEWWLQDTIKTAGAASDLMGIKKYMPWAPKIDLEEPRPTFLDPTRELAQQSEQANMAIQGLSQFAGPQGLSARASSIQGTGAKQAADTLSRYNNANVNLADQFEFKSVDIRNQEAIGNQASQSKMYDQNTMANQQYDNSKLALKNNLRNQFTNAITNRTKTAALNELYPQYNISPASGGMPGRGYGKNLKPETTKTANDYYEEMMAEDPDADQNITWKRAQSRAGTQTSNSNQLDIIDEQYSLAKKYGGNMKNGGFIYTTAFPWLL